MGDSREAIMQATFDALAEHGYADLTVQAIADEFDKSKSLILYHYDSKQALMAAFLDWLLEAFLESVEREAPADDPAERLRRMARLVVTGDGDDAAAFHTALLELRAQAPYDGALQAQLVRNDRRIRKRIADDVRAGIDAGQFRAVDPEAFAAAFRAAIEGAQSHDVILGDDAPTADALAGIERMLVDDLLVDGEARDGGEPPGRGHDGGAGRDRNPDPDRNADPDRTDPLGRFADVPADDEESTERRTDESEADH